PRVLQKGRKMHEMVSVILSDAPGYELVSQELAKARQQKVQVFHTFVHSGSDHIYFETTSKDVYLGLGRLGPGALAQLARRIFEIHTRLPGRGILLYEDEERSHATLAAVRSQGINWIVVNLSPAR
ncbi:MAG TPA: hypothetical protein VGC58_02025, partial [Candidatus Paceibacterota bacterium]